MPNPRRRHSRSRGRRRRTHWKIEKTQLMVCPKCREAKLPHRICGACGYYQGRLVLDFEAKKTRKAEKKKKKKSQ